MTLKRLIAIFMVTLAYGTANAATVTDPQLQRQYCRGQEISKECGDCGATERTHCLMCGNTDASKLSGVNLDNLKANIDASCCPNAPAATIVNISCALAKSDTKTDDKKTSTGPVFGADSYANRMSAFIHAADPGFEIIEKYCIGGEGTFDCLKINTNKVSSIFYCTLKPGVDEAAALKEVTAYCQERNAKKTTAAQVQPAVSAPNDEKNKPNTTAGTKTDTASGGANTQPAQVQPAVSAPNDQVNAPQITITGTVVDENNEPLGFVAIGVSGTTHATEADASGKFTLEKVPANANIVFSLLGYDTVTQAANTDMGTIKMSSAAAETLDGAVITAEGPKTGKPCTPTGTSDANGVYTYAADGKCTLTSCKNTKKYVVADGKCELTTGPCTTAQLAALDVNATAGQLAKGTCRITQCKSGYDPTNGAKCTPRATLSKEDQDKKIADLEQNANDMRAKERSAANRAIGALGIGATGIGTQMAAAAIAEQRADADAERDMQAYLETFRCDYGNGKNIRGGDTDIELPGGNAMYQLYAEYAELANSLKMRKAALNMAPGIESEIIIDKAETGLYDNVSIGVNGGAYASIARALMDPDGQDAAEWAAMKDATAQKLKTGAIVAGVGAAGSLVANILNNDIINKKKERSAKIIAEYEPMKKVFEDAQADFDALKPTFKCTDIKGATDDGNGNCKCQSETEYFDTDVNGVQSCKACPGGVKVGTNGTCNDCVTFGQIFQDNKCVTPQPEKCKLAGLVDDPNSPNCTCKDPNALDVEGTCKCKDGYEDKDDGTCKKKLTALEQLTSVFGSTGDDEVITINLETETLFKLNTFNLTNEAQAKVNNFVTQLTTAMADDQYPAIKNGEFCIHVVGHTDKSGDQKPGLNDGLSQKRANAVSQAIIAANASLQTLVKATGKGSRECITTNPKGVEQSCRRVDITLVVGKCD